VKTPAVVAAIILGLIPHPLHAQGNFSGQVSVLGNAFADQPRTPELRSRAFAKETVTVGPHVRFDVAGFAEGLLTHGTPKNRAGVAEFDEASVQISVSRLDLLAGFTRAVWGRLDEIQPSDVVNPLDLSKFFSESREAARMPVGLIRGRLHLTESATIELVAVPRFRAGRFDRLDEANSPFNPARLPLPVQVQRPSGDVWSQMQGGGRLTASTRRVDWAIGAYRGFRPLQVYTLRYQVAGIPAAPVTSIRIDGTYPRFRMVSADFETAFSRWTLRGEAVASDEDAIQARATPVSASGRTVQVGLGADRSLAGNRLLGELVWYRAALDAPSLPLDPLTAAPPRFDRRSFSAVAIAERQFARGTRVLRGFGLYDAVARNGLARAIAAISPRDGLWLESSIVWFSGRRAGFVGPFVDDDFVSVRITKHF
jgi:hypothetical protein